MQTRSLVTNRRLASVMLLTLLLGACNNERTSSPMAASSQHQTSHWLPVWNASPTDVSPASPLLPGQVIRQFIAPHADGERVRLKLSNELGTAPVSLVSVTLGLQADGAALQADSIQELLFNGRSDVSIAPGESIVSDPLAFPVRAFAKVAVSFTPSSPITQMPHHYTAREVPYMAAVGASTKQIEDTGFIPLSPDAMNSWQLISGLEVERTAAQQTVVALGDSITDGFIGNALPLAGSSEGVGLDARYPDFLARRVLAAGLTQFSVVNAGISGNSVGKDGILPMFGPSLLKRLQRDVLDLPNVRTVILLEGINDLGIAPVPDAEGLIENLNSVILSLKAHGIRVLIGTLMPARGTRAAVLAMPDGFIEPGLQHGTAEVEAARQQVNTWIRNSSPAQAVIDFDACLRDPEHPAYLRADYDSGDHLHPNVAGYQAMAGCIDLSLL